MPLGSADFKQPDDAAPDAESKRNPYRIRKTVLTIVLVIAAVQIAVALWQYRQGRNYYSEIRETAIKQTVDGTSRVNEAGSNEADDADGTAYKDDTDQADGKGCTDGTGRTQGTGSGQNEPGITVDFVALHKINPDIVAWIRFDDGRISYPVLQAEDNTTYLHTLPDGTGNPSGSIFADAGCPADFSGAVTILYGHNQRDGSMFGSLKQYRNKGFYEKHREFTIYLPDRTVSYRICGWYVADPEDEIYQIGFSHDDVFQAYLQKLEQKREKNLPVTMSKEDAVVVLSTCASGGKRFVVYAKQKGEP